MDSSAMVEFLVGASATAETVRERLARSSIAAPHALDLECASAVRRLAQAGRLPPTEARRGLELLGGMRIRRFAHTPLLNRVWELRVNMWPYDAAFVALAETLDTELVTIDHKFEGVPGVRCPVRNLRPAPPMG